MEKLYNIFMKNEISIHKWENYFDIYEQYLNNFRNNFLNFWKLVFNMVGAYTCGTNTFKMLKYMVLI